MDYQYFDITNCYIERTKKAVMGNKNLAIQTENIKNSIFTIRGVQVMIDKDIAQLYQVNTKALNQTVKRNINRFPDNFRFQLTEEEARNLRSQIVTSSLVVQDEVDHGGRRYLPYAFTEQGVSMLAGILKSDIAVEISIRIIITFVEMRRFFFQNAILFNRISTIEQKQITTDIKQIETEKKIDTILDALESRDRKPQQGIFYDGQVFDAYLFISDLIKSATKSILLIDNFIDESVLQLFTKRKKAVSVTIYTKNITRILRQDLEKHNSQYPKIEILEFTKAHDRFLLIDETDIYHFGASLKALGKKWFAFSKMDMKAIEMITMLSEKNNDSEYSTVSILETAQHISEN